MTPAPIKIALVGIGKIAHDQHAPALAKSADFDLVATASRSGALDGVKAYDSIEALLAGEPELEAVGLCLPPQPRFGAAKTALEAGKHVLLEKPPGATLSEVAILSDLAARKGLSLFATWHARHAPGVDRAKAWLADRRIDKVEVDWREDVRHWHPGQAWIWEPGGLGVFDPGINALSIVTKILPRPFYLKSGTLDFPSNRAAPIAAQLAFEDSEGVPINVTLDWLQTGVQTWAVRVETDGGELVLSKGGAALSLAGQTVVDAPEAEYPSLYSHFAELVRGGGSDVDVSPLRHAADAFLNGRRNTVAPFLD